MVYSSHAERTEGNFTLVTERGAVALILIKTKILTLV